MRQFVGALVVVTMMGFIFAANVPAQKARAVAADTSVVQQPLYTDFRGVKLGMTPEEVRQKLGNPVLKDTEMDYFVLSDTLSAQVVYDAMHKARMISADYASGAGAPDARAVVGPELITKPDGSAYAMIRYASLGFWVSYNRTADPMVIVTITIQKI